MAARITCFVLAAFLSLSAFAVGLVEILFRWQVKPRLETGWALQEKYLPAYLDDQKFLLENPRAQLVRALPPTTQKEADAGPALNDKLFWAPPITPNSIHGAKQPLVPNDVRETLLRFRGEWMKKNQRAEHMRADLSIFNGLSRFTYWDIERGSPIADLIERHEFVPPSALPIPEVSDLLAAIKLRLMWGAITGEFLPALSDVRQFAQLLLTTENMQLTLAGLAMLDDERLAYQYYVEERHLDPHLWVPIERNVTRRAARAIQATRAYLHLWTKTHILSSVFVDAPQAPVGFCAAANEAFPLEYSLRDRLEPHWPLEISLKSQYADLDQIYKRALSTCHLHYLTDLVANHAISARVPGPLFLNKLPYARKVFGLHSSVMSFVGFSPYEMAPP